ncbi:putative sugar phosphate/phosphate translocator [Camellia lanceoleosa]|uniref:Sugar phosphate/phosphate translocator n=1 Tax=Camellia lanceoleosa TaxID=1840588 RepID=A0ACC0HGA2_9ERIC|nr:putative sugar phosphate/phosphate translocator [Camellia lanceoleosa]
MVSKGKVWVGASHSHRKSAISGIDVMKYNKTLLGDDLGKFLAPLLMNTFHFAMQVVLSTAITWFWPQRFQPGVTMSLRDYCMRVPKWERCGVL